MSGILSAFVGGTYSSTPVNSVAPVVSGTATFGQTLSCTTGTWTGVPTPTYTYQWQRAGSNIGSATSSTYVLVQADVGSTIRCVVTATNSVGSASANSNSTATVAATVPGAPTIGTATATGSTTATVTYTAPASNGGATITTYTATSSPGGITGTLSTSGSGTITVSGLTTNTAYTFTVKATNSVGQSAASSASNSVTPVASGFLATESFSGGTYTDSKDVALGSDGNVYKIPRYQGGGSGYLNTVVQYSSTGTLNWKYYGFNTSQNFVIETDSSNNYYVCGRYSNTTVQVSKFNSSNTLQWSKYINLGTDTSANVMTKPVIDSSGNVYLGYQIAISGGCCCPTTYQYSFVKFNSSGTIQYGANYNSGGSDFGQPAGVGVDSSGNYYNVMYGYDSGYANVVIYKTNSSNTLVDRKYYKGSPSSGVEPWGYVFDTTNSVGYVCGNNANGFIMKHDTSMAVSWAYNFTGSTAFYGIDVDSSGNVYAVGYLYGAQSSSIIIVKVNSSGSLQWARQLTFSSTYYYIGGETKISVSGSKFVICSQITNNPSTSQKTFTFQAPTDGSGTGSIVNAGITWTYASSSVSAVSRAMGSITTGSQTNNTPTTNVTNPSLTTASNWSTSTTAF